MPHCNIFRALIHKMSIRSSAGKKGDDSDMQEPKKAQTPKNLGDLPDELLLQIIAEVPPESRFGPLDVSQRWHSIVSDLGYYVEPDFIGWYETPYYPSDWSIKLNPIIENFDKPMPICWWWRRGFHHWGEITQRDLPKLYEKRSEFLTSPPVSAVRLSWADDWKKPRGEIVELWLRTATSALKHSQGVRIGNLLDVFEKMKAQTPGDCSGYALGMTLATTFRSDYGEYVITQKAIGNAGIEHRKFKYR